MRTGVLAVKIGVIPQWTTAGEKFHTTLLQVLDNHVIRYVPPEEYSKSLGYNKKWLPKQYGSVVVGALSADPFKFTKKYCGLFAESGLPPKRKLTRFIVTADAAVQPATPLYASHFRVGDYVDVQAKTIGHGFQGVVKRWGFRGGPASHGTTKWHRRPGNIGGGRGKGKVWKGRKLPGHMGMERRSLKGLKIWRINTKYNILYVHSQNIPGPTHCYVRVFDSTLPHRRKQMAERPPIMPTYYADDEPQPEELFAEGLFKFTDESIIFPETVKVKQKK
jgi:large subunit ribosomal protein L3